MSFYYKLTCTLQCYRDRIFQALLGLILLSILLGLLAYLYWSDWRHTVLKEILQRGEMVVLTRNAPTTYYEAQNGQYAGLEYDLVSAYAEHLGVKLRFVIKDTQEAVLASLDQGEADFAAAGLSITPQRSIKYLFGPSYQSVHQQVVCRRNHNGIPEFIDELQGREIRIPSETSYAERLQQLQNEHPRLHWQQDSEADTELLLWRVWKRELDCTVSDSHILALSQRYYPELTPAFELNDYAQLAWVLPDNARYLQADMNKWQEQYIHTGGLNDLMERYYGHLEAFDYVDSRRFRNAILRVLPKYRRWFKQAAQQYGLDWTLLAALAYQESHWNPYAKSPTGVRGIMMLTQPTAKQLGVNNRLDAKSNIFAGAEYLAQLYTRLPASISEPERSWMVLAAYNMGYAHWQDASDLAEQMGLDPQRWIDLEQVLPLLSQRRYYKNLPHGYARGYEALEYVGRVREYHQILRQHN